MLLFSFSIFSPILSSSVVKGSLGLPCIGLIPLCVKAFKDIEHVNPNDGSVVGKYDRGADLGLK